MKQTKQVKEYIERNGSITAKQAMDDLGVYRLGARIWDLKNQGEPIKSGWITVVNRFGEPVRIKSYWMDTEAGKRC